MPPVIRLPDLVQDSRIETNVIGGRTEHVFYDVGRSLQERQTRRVESWIREDVLGKGAYGTVYRERSEHGGTSPLRAVKEISKYVVGEALDYTRELEAIIKFSHRNYNHCFVRSDGWFEMGDSIFITMEYIAFGDLQRYLAKPLPEPEARRITGQVLEGLGFMHDNGFVHRDLKPGNIMVVTKGPNWFVKIADFGISKRRQQGVTTLHTLQLGTLGFAAPEVLGLETGTSSGSYTFAVDMWSLGSVAYTMLTSSLAFQNAAGPVLYAVGATKFPFGPLQSHDVSEIAQDFIVSLMAAKPEERLSASSAANHAWLSAQLAVVAESTTGSSIPSTAIEDTIETFSTVTSASVAWSYDNISTMLQKTVIEPKKHPNYQPPSVEDCADTHDVDPKTVLSNDSPVVLDDAIPSSAATVLPPNRTEEEHKLAEQVSSRKSAVVPEFPEAKPREAYGSERSVSSISDGISVEGKELDYQDNHWSTTASDGGIEHLTNKEILSMPKPCAEVDDTFLQARGIQKDPVSLNFRRKSIYTLRLTHLFMDKYGRPWLAPSLRPTTLPRFQRWDSKSIEDFWAWQEKRGNARRLKSIRPNDRIVDDGNESPTAKAGSAHACFVCGHTTTTQKETDLKKLGCGHWHCEKCLKWAFQFCATDARLNFPRCCSSLIPFKLVVHLLTPAYERFSEWTNGVRCTKSCGKQFYPEYAARDPNTSEWVVYCPHCESQLCFFCDAATEEARQHVKTASGCPSRASFRLTMDNTLEEQYRNAQAPSARPDFDSSDSFSESSSGASSTYAVTGHEPTTGSAGHEAKAGLGQPASKRRKPPGRDPVLGSLSRCQKCDYTCPSPKSWNAKVGRLQEINKLPCGHLLCEDCILEWVALCFASPLDAWPLCRHSTDIGADNALWIGSKFYSDSYVRGTWAKYLDMHRLRRWRCADSTHPLQVFMDLDESTTWKQFCVECDMDYCLRCGGEWHDLLCPEAHVAKRMISRLREDHGLSDLLVDKRISHIMRLEDNLRFQADDERLANGVSSGVAAGYYSLSPSESSSVIRYVEEEDEDGYDAAGESLFRVSRHALPELFSQDRGEFGEGTVLHGLTRGNILTWRRDAEAAMQAKPEAGHHGLQRAATFQDDTVGKADRPSSFRFDGGSPFRLDDAAPFRMDGPAPFRMDGPAPFQMSRPGPPPLARAATFRTDGVGKAPQA